MHRQQASPFRRGVPTHATVLTVIGGAEPTAGAVPKMDGPPMRSRSALLEHIPPLSLLLILGECPCQVLHLNQLSNESSGRIPIVFAEQDDGASRELAGDLHHRCEANGRVAARNRAETHPLPGHDRARIPASLRAAFSTIPLNASAPTVPNRSRMYSARLNVGATEEKLGQAGWCRLGPA